MIRLRHTFKLGGTTFAFLAAIITVATSFTGVNAAYGLGPKALSSLAQFGSVYGAGSYGDCIYAMTGCATAPGLPTNLTATPGSGQIGLTWSPPTDDGGASITDYKVEISSDGTTWSTISHTASTTPSLTATGLTPSATYYFRVSAVNAVGAGTPSSPLTAQTAFITLNGISTVSLNVTPTATGALSTQRASASVTTNVTTGYTLTLSTTGATTSLVSGSNTISAASGTVASPNSGLTSGRWGFHVENLGSFGSGISLTSNTACTNYTWAGVPASSSPVTVHSSSAPVTSEQTDIWFGVCANRTLPGGTYSQSLVITAVSN